MATDTLTNNVMSCCAHLLEHNLKHDVFTVQVDQRPEQWKGHHAQLQAKPHQDFHERCKRSWIQRIVLFFGWLKSFCQKTIGSSQKKHNACTLVLVPILEMSESSMGTSSCFSVVMKRRNVSIRAGSVIFLMNSSRYAVAAITSSIEFCPRTQQWINPLQTQLKTQTQCESNLYRIWGSSTIHEVRATRKQRKEHVSSAVLWLALAYCAKQNGHTGQDSQAK